jgi:hypothetical protein
VARAVPVELDAAQEVRARARDQVGEATMQCACRETEGGDLRRPSSERAWRDQVNCV